nr:Chain C, CYS-TYR-THR-TRP-ASN-GLN-MET-ASN-LEU [Homo sapiens]8ISN_F Chain F, CYS-TYR-THR-TRP-ASN-GLN-MET-ASN-LEU [Homo sapiens]
CYTWNQMNL